MSVTLFPERTRISVDRYEKMFATGVLTEYDRVELIDGDMINMPGVNPPHSAITARLTEVLVLSVAGSAIVSPGGSVRLGDYSLPQPDLMLLKRRDDFYFSQRPAVTDILLLIEVSDSSLAYDRSIKRNLYARYGVGEYWVIDVQGERICVHTEPGPDGYRQVAEFAADDVVSPRALPAIQIRVGSLFGEPQ
jgi:Uma2 family endonuclease